MILDIHVTLRYSVQAPTDLLLQIQVPDLAGQSVLSENLDVGRTDHHATVEAESGIGRRTLVRVDQDFACDYTAQVEVHRDASDIAAIAGVEVHDLPSEAIRYLMPSRYCPADELQSYVAAEFADTAGGERVAAMRDWVFERFTYAPGSSNAQTTAVNTLVQRQGVCRDFAHVMVGLARASGIPARFCSVYAPHVTPQDFHAVAQVYLDGGWYFVDATGMAAADHIALIGVGLDAAEVSFLSGFGPIVLDEQIVEVSES